MPCINVILGATEEGDQMTGCGPSCQCTWTRWGTNMGQLIRQHGRSVRVTDRSKVLWKQEEAITSLQNQARLHREFGKWTWSWGVIGILEAEMLEEDPLG